MSCEVTLGEKKLTLGRTSLFGCPGLLVLEDKKLDKFVVCQVMGPGSITSLAGVKSCCFFYKFLKLYIPIGGNRQFIT